MNVKGTFEVRLTPQHDPEAPAGRMVMKKSFDGGMKGTASGQMISKRTENGASVYYAVEEFSGELAGKSGGFTLVHSGYMDENGQKLDVTILDGSGSGELEGITGSMEILNDDSGHRYELTYSF